MFGVETKKSVNVFSKEQISITVPKRIKKNLSFSIKYQSPLIPPINSKEPIGEFLIKKNRRFLKNLNFIQMKMCKNEFSKNCSQLKVFTFW